MKSFSFVLSICLLQFLVVASVAAPRKRDSTPPKISSRVKSNTITSKEVVLISIHDKSDTTTQVLKDGVLLLTSTSKSFDLNLNDGVNNFVIKSIDSHQNQSADFVLTNIVLDKKPPVLSSSVASGVYTNVNKIQITVSDLSEVTTRITANTNVSTTTEKQFELTLQEGLNGFVLTAKDALKNKADPFYIENVTLDTKKPSIVTGLGSDTVTRTPTFSVTVNDSNTTTTQVFKDGTLVRTETAKNFSYVLSEGVNNLLFKVTDAAGNVTEHFVSNLIYDTQAPIITASVQSNSITNNNRIKIRIEDASSVTTAIYRDGTFFSNQNFKEFDIVLPEGTSSFVLKAVDQVNNAAPDFTISNITLDTIAPKITANIQSNSIVPTGKFTIAVSDATGVTTQVFRNGILISTQTTKSFEVDLIAGRNDFIFKSVDAAQNSSADLILNDIAITNDAEPPVLASSLSSNIITNVAKVSFTVTDQSSVTTQVFNNDSLVATELGKSFDFTLSEGVNNLVLKSKDQYNNQAADFLVSNVVLDTVAPKITSNVSSQTTVTYDKIQISIIDANSVTTQVFKNGELIATETSKVFELTLTPGSNSFVLKSMDTASNTSVDFILSDVVLKVGDIVPPLIMSSRISYEATTQNKVQITISDVSSVSTQIYKEGILVETTESKEFELTLQEGVNNFRLVSVDAAQNVTELELSSITLKTNFPVPSTVIIRQDQYSIVQFMADNLDTLFSQLMEISKNGSAVVVGPFDQSGISTLVLPLEEGMNTFEVKFYDWFGNPSPATSVSLFFDGMPPRITTDIQSNSFTNKDKIHITIEDTSFTYAELISDGVVLGITEEKEWDIAIPEGSLNFQLNVVDSSGNQSVLTVENVIVDRTKPNITTTLQAQYRYSSFPQSEDIRVNSDEILNMLSINGFAFLQSGLTTYGYTVTFDQPGIKNFTFIGVDLAGNETVIQQSVDIVVNQQAPVITANRKSNDSTTVSNLHISITDELDVSTEIYKEGVLVGTTSSKVFDHQLDEGVNNLKFRATNSSNKVTELEISNLTLNSKIPQILSLWYDAGGGYYVLRTDSSGTLFSNLVEVNQYGNLIANAVPDLSGMAQLILSLQQNTSDLEIRYFDVNGDVSPSFPLVFDVEPPVITADVQSNTITNKEKIHISIQDASFTYSQLISDGMIVQINDEKEFDIWIPEGALPTYYLKVKDAIGNESSLTLSNIVVDRNGPVLSTNLEPYYNYSSFPQSETITVEVNEAISMISLNGIPMLQVGSFTYAYTINFESVGAKSFNFIAMDMAGNESVLKQSTVISIESSVGPVITANRKSNDSTVLSNLDVLIVDDEIVTTEIYKDNLLLETTTQKEIHLVLTEGLNNFKFHAVNANNKVTDFELSNVTLNTKVPKIASVVEDVNSYIVQTDHSGSLYLSTIEVRQSGIVKASAVPDSNGIGRVSIPKQSDMNNLEIVFYDTYGNISPATPLNIVTDTNPPLITASVSSGVLTKNSKVQITVADESNVRTQVFKDGNQILSVTDKSFELTLEEGSNSFVLRSMDSYGNISDDFYLNNVLLDSVAPVITSDLIDQYKFNSLPQNVTINISVDELLQSLSLNGQLLVQISPMTYTYTIQFNEFGTKQFTFIGVDLAGNETVVQQSVAILPGDDADIQPPQIISSVSSGQQTSSRTVTFQIIEQSAVESIITFEDGTKTYRYTKLFEIELSPGPNSFSVQSTDEFGNKATLNLANVFYEPNDNSPHYYTSLKSNSITSAASVRITTFGTSNYANISVKLNGSTSGETFPWSGVLDVQLIEGRNDIEVSFLDEAGGSVPWFTLTNIVKDSILPVITADVSANGFTNKGSVTIRVVDANFANFQIYEEGSLKLTTSYDLRGFFLSEGVHKNFQIVARDKAGNVAVKSLGDITADQTPPIISTDLSDFYEFNTLPQMKTFTVELSEEVQTLSVNGSALIKIGPTSYSYTIEFSEYGIKDLNFIAVDFAGNETVYQYPIRILEDTDAPQIAAELPAFIAADSYDLSISIYDEQDVTTSVYVDGVEVITQTEKQFVFTIEFDPALQSQIKVVKIVSVDSNNKKSEKILAAVKNTTPLSLEVVSPVPNSVVESEEAFVHVVANKLLQQTATINGQPVAVQGDGLSVKGIIYYPKDSDQIINVAVTDITGETATLSIPITIKTIRMPAWDYQECPVNQQ